MTTVSAGVQVPRGFVRFRCTDSVVFGTEFPNGSIWISRISSMYLALFQRLTQGNKNRVMDIRQAFEYLKHSSSTLEHGIAVIAHRSVIADLLAAWPVLQSAIASNHIHSCDVDFLAPTPANPLEHPITVVPCKTSNSSGDDGRTERIAKIITIDVLETYQLRVTLAWNHIVTSGDVCVTPPRKYDEWVPYVSGLLAKFHVSTLQQIVGREVKRRFNAQEWRKKTDFDSFDPVQPTVQPIQESIKVDVKEVKHDLSTNCDARTERQATIDRVDVMDKTLQVYLQWTGATSSTRDLCTHYAQTTSDFDTYTTSLLRKFNVSKLQELVGRQLKGRFNDREWCDKTDFDSLEAVQTLVPPRVPSITQESTKGESKHETYSNSSATMVATIVKVEIMAGELRLRVELLWNSLALNEVWTSVAMSVVCWDAYISTLLTKFHVTTLDKLVGRQVQGIFKLVLCTDFDSLEALPIVAVPPIPSSRGPTSTSESKQRTVQETSKVESAEPALAMKETTPAESTVTPKESGQERYSAGERWIEMVNAILKNTRMEPLARIKLCVDLLVSSADLWHVMIRTILKNTDMEPVSRVSVCLGLLV
jgi:hypothetical protein